MVNPPESSDPAAVGSDPRVPAGLRDSLREMARSALRHLQLRCALFGLETAEAAGHLCRVAAAAALALVGGALAYLTGWAWLVIWAARRWAGGDLLPPLGVMAGVHALVALGAVWWLVARGRNPALFAATRAEFEEDQKWLHHRNP